MPGLTSLFQKFKSSPGLETEGVLKMFQRSEEQRGLVYRSYIADGDSKGFAAVRNAARPLLEKSDR